jgi:ubiquinone/menaquinone biosynthesis C-methylase UbiE
MTARDGPPITIQVIGRTLSWLVANVPAAWPLLRRPTRRFWDRMAGEWSERGSSAGRHDALETACGRIGAEPARIADVGTGTGAAAVLLAQRFPRAQVTGVDLSSEMVEAARTALPEELRGRVSFVAADAAALPIGDGSLDLLVQLNVPVYFDEIARVLAPGGAVIVASSFGPATPYFTPERTLRRRFAARGLRDVETGASGPGTFFIARAGGGGPRA